MLSKVTSSFALENFCFWLRTILCGQLTNCPASLIPSFLRKEGERSNLVKKTCPCPHAVVCNTSWRERRAHRALHPFSTDVLSATSELAPAWEQQRANRTSPSFLELAGGCGSKIKLIIINMHRERHIQVFPFGTCYTNCPLVFCFFPQRLGNSVGKRMAFGVQQS